MYVGKMNRRGEGSLWRRWGGLHIGAVGVMDDAVCSIRLRPRVRKEHKVNLSSRIRKSRKIVRFVS